MQTSFMDQSNSYDAISSSATQEIPSILWTINVHHRIHKSLPLVN